MVCFQPWGLANVAERHSDTVREQPEAEPGEQGCREETWLEMEEADGQKGDGGAQSSLGWEQDFLA